jgi:hypothetical protein
MISVAECPVLLNHSERSGRGEVRPQKDVSSLAQAINNLLENKNFTILSLVIPLKDVRNLQKKK